MPANEVDFLISSQWLAARSGDSAVVLIDTRPSAEYWADIWRVLAISTPSRSIIAIPAMPA